MLHDTSRKRRLDSAFRVQLSVSTIHAAGREISHTYDHTSSSFCCRKKSDKDEIDGSTADLVHLLLRIRHDSSQITMLGGKELELLSDMDPDSLGDIIQDK